MNRIINIGDDRYVLKHSMLQEQYKNDEQLKLWIDYNHADIAVPYEGNILFLELIKEAILITDDNHIPEIKITEPEVSVLANLSKYAHKQKSIKQLKKIISHGKSIQRTNIKRH